ncbi:MAG: NUDIX domain-containing protein [Rhodospirillaceae bacterium]
MARWSRRAPTADPSKPVEIVARTTPYDGFFSLDVYQVRHGLYQGGHSPTLSRECLERGHAVAMLLYDPQADAVVLVEQFRIGAYAAGMEPWVIEVPAGLIEPGEDPKDVAARETVEETGCTAVDLFEVSTYLASPGCTSESITLYCGRVESSAVGGIHGLPEEGEDIRVMAVPAAELPPMLERGAITNATGLIAIYWFLANREALRQRWN